MPLPDFIESFMNRPLDDGQFAAMHLGQQSFILRIADKTVWLDPFLSPLSRRLVPPPLPPQDVIGADIVTGSHDHADHIDRPVLPAIAQASPNAVFVFPEAVRHSIQGIPAERVRGLNDGCSVTIGGVRISGVASAHELLDRDPATGLYPYLGYVIQYAGVTVYHAGDCCLYEGFLPRLRAFGKINLAFLPINGRDAVRLSRNCIGCMTFQEAADLAGAIGFETTVPAHFDMFPGNTEDPDKFIQYMAVKYPRLKTWRPAPKGTFFSSNN